MNFFRRILAFAVLGITLAAFPRSASAGLTSVSLDDNYAFDVPSGEFVKVPYMTELYDDINSYDLRTNTLTADWNGMHRICASLLSPGQVFELDLYINDQRENAFAIATYGAAEGCRFVWLNQGDQLDVRVYQNSGATVTFPRNPYWAWMTVEVVNYVLSAENNDTVTVPYATFTTIPFQTELEDPSNAYDPQTGIFVASQKNAYEVCASVASFAQDFEIDAYVNGVREKAIAISKYGIAVGCRTVLLNQGDSLEIRAYQASAGAMIIYPNSYWNWITVNRRSTSPYDSMGDIRPFSAQSGEFTTVTYVAPIGESSGGYDVNTGRFTAMTDSNREFCASLASFTGAFELDLYVNGIRENAIAISNYGAAQGCRIIKTRKGDYVEVKVHQASTPTMSFPGNGFWNWLIIESAG